MASDMARETAQCRSCKKFLPTGAWICRGCRSEVGKTTWVKFVVILVSVIDVVGMVSPPKEDFGNSLPKIFRNADGDLG